MELKSDAHVAPQVNVSRWDLRKRTIAGGEVPKEISRQHVTPDVPAEGQTTDEARANILIIMMIFQGQYYITRIELVFIWSFV